MITWGEPEPSWDQQIEIIELPRAFRTTVASIPNHVPYLNVRTELGSNTENGSRPIRVGIVWASSTYNPERSIQLKDLAELFALPGAAFFSLQAGPARAELDPWSNRVTNLYDDSACVLAMAQTLKTIDLVITVDTMMAHLAGAIARPVWTLLPYQCDWRWMLNRQDSPWYPTMRLFRQKRPGDWAGVVSQLKRELWTFIRNPEYEAPPSCQPSPPHPIASPGVQEA